MIQSYQTLIVGLLGFSSVVITMLANAKLQRNQHDREILHEANSLRTALVSELNANINAYKLRIEQFNEPNRHSAALVPNYPKDSIYKELLNKIGLLSEKEIEKIINAYALLSELTYRIRILVGKDNVTGFNNESIRIGADNLEVVSKIHISILPELIKATDEIDTQLRNL